MEARGRNSVVQFFGMTALILFGCGLALAQDVTYNAAPGANFSKYKTYKWVKIDGAEAPDQIIDQQIRQSIDSQLAAKGFTKATGDTADLFVGYQLSITQERQWNAYGSGGIRFGGGMASATSTTLQIGTLGFDVYDAAAKQLLWRGSATKTLNPPKDPEKKQKNLDKGVAKLLQNFPPPAPKK